MRKVAIRVLEGLERGRLFSHLAPPITIGREEDNQVQLNDERISRFHAKLQDDDGRLILTDLDSTNGTRVNGHPIQIRILRSGDLVTVGRCVLQIVYEQPDVDEQSLATLDDPTSFSKGQLNDSGSDMDFVDPPAGIADHPGEMFPGGAPDLPEQLRPLQKAQLHDVVHFLHVRLSEIMSSGVEQHSDEDRDSADEDSAEIVEISRTQWLRLADVQLSLATYLKRLGEPD